MIDIGDAAVGNSRGTADAILAALRQELEHDPSVFVYGEGINDPSGFFGTTVGLAREFPGRVLDVPNCEESLVGLGIGAALGGLRPIFVNLRIEFLLLAMNQVVNHAAKWQAMTQATELPLTIRAMTGRGWGQGAQHSGIYAPLFAHVPGLEVAVASGPKSAAGLIVAAVRSPNPTIVIEPKGMFSEVEVVGRSPQAMSVGTASVVRSGTDITLIATGDAVRIANEAADALMKDAISVEVVDTLWMAPFDANCIAQSVAKTRRIGVVDHGWSPFGLAAEVARVVLRAGIPIKGSLLEWSPIGHAPAGCFAEANHYPTTQEIVGEVKRSMGA